MSQRTTPVEPLREVDLNEEEHPWPCPNGGMLVQFIHYTALDHEYYMGGMRGVNHWATMHGHFTPDMLRRIADHMEGDKVVWRVDDDPDA